jgi:hypothetical protein
MKTTIITALVFSYFFTINISKTVKLQPIKVNDHCYILNENLKKEYPIAFDTLTYKIQQVDLDTIFKE